jgi:hypothetical protein
MTQPLFALISAYAEFGSLGRIRGRNREYMYALPIHYQYSTNQNSNARFGDLTIPHSPRTSTCSRSVRYTFIVDGGFDCEFTMLQSAMPISYKWIIGQE